MLSNNIRVVLLIIHIQQNGRTIPIDISSANSFTFSFAAGHYMTIIAVEEKIIQFHVYYMKGRDKSNML